MGQEQEVFFSFLHQSRNSIQGIVGLGCGGMVSEELQKTEKKKIPCHKHRHCQNEQKLFGPGEKVEPVPLVPKEMGARVLYMWAKHEWPQRALAMQGFPSQANRPWGWGGQVHFQVRQMRHVYAEWLFFCSFTTPLGPNFSWVYWSRPWLPRKPMKGLDTTTRAAGDWLFHALVVFRDLMAKSNLARKNPNKPLKATSTAERPCPGICRTRTHQKRSSKKRVDQPRGAAENLETWFFPSNRILNIQYYIRVGGMEVHVLEKRWNKVWWDEMWWHGRRWHERWDERRWHGLRWGGVRQGEISCQRVFRHALVLEIQKPCRTHSLRYGAS